MEKHEREAAKAAWEHATEVAARLCEGMQVIADGSKQRVDQHYCALAIRDFLL